MSLRVLLTVFALILPAELPDKTMVATLVLSTRFRADAVWLGTVAGFVVQSGVAVLAGGAVSLLPSVLVHAIAAALFLVGAVLLLRHDPNRGAAEEEQEIEAEIATVAAPSFRRAAVTSFAIIFAAEWGDLTQILTANLAAKYGAPLEVFVGSLLALALVAAVGVIGGRALLRVVPLRVISRLAAALFFAMAVVTVVEAVRSS
jgi:putative Ca2+/H+ antiporter (TMEM165/GDT1 family)